MVIECNKILIRDIHCNMQQIIFNKIQMCSIITLQHSTTALDTGKYFLYNCSCTHSPHSKLSRLQLQWVLTFGHKCQTSIVVIERPTEMELFIFASALAILFNLVFHPFYFKSFNNKYMAINTQQLFEKHSTLKH